MMSTIIVFNTACADTEMSKRDAKIKQLTRAPWFPESVVHEADGDLTHQYETLAFSFTKNGSADFDGEYFVVNGGVAFPDAVGKWKFSDSLSTIILNNGQEVDAVVKDNALTLAVVVLPASGGRVQSVTGRLTFRLTH
jgi:hypothetical protein